jgi:UDP-GlcNAc:undecaprenyl-phosphate GlcNAc-1-phosphate transferase
VVTAIGIAVLLVMTVWLRLRAIVQTPDKPKLDSNDKPSN